MAYLAVMLVVILAVELLLRLPLVRLGRNLSALFPKVTRVVSSRHISDHWKEKALLAYAANMALLTFKIAAMLMGIALGVILGSLGLDALLSPQVSTIDFLMTLQGIELATAGAIAYSVVRRRLVS